MRNVLATGRQADHIVGKALQFKRDQETLDRATPPGNAAAGQRNMIIGGIVCVVGLAVTLGSITLARESGGGRWFLAWGAIIFGAIQFFRGYQQSKN